MVNRIVSLCIVAMTAMLFYGCGGNSNSEMLRLVEERDSLRKENEKQCEILSSYGNTIATLNETLDSVAYQENMLFINVGEMPVTKEDVKHNLMRFEALLKKQSEKIKQLELQLAESKDVNEQSLGLIAHLKEQLAAKNSQILHLKRELENKNVNIARLQEQVASQKTTINTQTATISELNQRTKRQGEALARQDAMLNNGYVLIGSKDDLTRKGVLRNGRLVADAALDRGKFAKIDIREWREVTFSAQRPRILTNMPASSYEITTTGNHNFTLTVKNPSDFWRISTYLVIQTN